MTTLKILSRNNNRVRHYSRLNISSRFVKPRLIVGILLAGALAISAQAQDSGTPQPPAIGKVMAALPSDGPGIAAILATGPDEPVGPSDILRNYEQGMAVVSQQTYIALAQVAEAVRQGQVGGAQAEHLSYEIYQTGMMQFQLLSTLHQILESDIAKAAQRSRAPQLTGSAGSFRGAGPPDPSRAARESNLAAQGLVPLTQ